MLMSICVCCCLQATHGCGDLVFSSHTTFVLTGVLTFTEYGETLLIKARHGLVGACGVCDCEPRAMVALELSHCGKIVWMVWWAHPCACLNQHLRLAGFVANADHCLDWRGIHGPLHCRQPQGGWCGSPDCYVAAWLASFKAKQHGWSRNW